MRTMRSFFGVVAALLPILYIGGLLLHLNNVRNAFGGLLDGQLGPTMIGLAGIGLVLVFALALKLRRLAAPPRPGPRAGGDAGRGAGQDEGAESDFDADAAFARYMARRGAGQSGAPVPPPSGAGGPPPREGFGRKRR